MENHNKRVTRSMNWKSRKGSSSTSSKPLSATRSSMPGKRKLEARLGEGADAPVEANAKSFPIFPDELLLEIMSYYPKPRDLVSSEATEYQAGHAIENATRRNTLLALSQSCRSLRWYLRPYICSRIEVCPGTLDEFSEGRRKSNIAISRMYNEELVRQLEMVTVRDPSLAKLVKLINVEVTDFSIASVLLELARCMALFPNLRVVKLGVSPPMSYSDPFHKSAKQAFPRYSYPQIEVVSLSQAAYPLLFCCPNLRSADRMEKYSVFHGSVDFLQCVKIFCPLLESLTFNMETGSSGLEVLVAWLPHLRQITLRFPLYVSPGDEGTRYMYGALERLQRLQSIQIETSDACDASSRQYFVDCAVRVLLSLQRRDKKDKEVKLRYLEDSSSTAEYKTETTYLPAPSLN